MKNVVECPREFIAYFNALETTCDKLWGLENMKFLTSGVFLDNGSIYSESTDASFLIPSNYFSELEIFILVYRSDQNLLRNCRLKG
jgi:hypothetical protein